MAVLAAMTITDTGPAWLLVLPTAVAISAAWWLSADVLEDARRAETPDDVVRDDPTASRGDARLRSLRINLMSLTDERVQRLHTSLVALIDDQLAVAYGIDRLAQPERARAVLGDELAEFAASPPPTGISFRHVERIVTQIERL